MSNNTVTIVKVKAPWYAFDFILPGQFKKTIPLYSKVRGLRFKAFSINKDNNGKNFGGIYLWDNTTDAQRWYSPAWYAEVKNKRGAEPQVSYFDLADMITHLPEGKSYADLEKNSVAILVPQPDERALQSYIAGYEGIFRIYRLQDKNQKNYLMLFFVSSKQVGSFVSAEHIAGYELYRTPVLLKNAGL